VTQIEYHERSNARIMSCGFQLYAPCDLLKTFQTKKKKIELRV